MHRTSLYYSFMRALEVGEFYLRVSNNGCKISLARLKAHPLDIFVKKV